MKKGITLTVLAATVVIMFIIIGVSSAFGVSSIKTAAYEEFMSKVKRVSDYVNEYYLKNGELPIGTEIISKEGLEDSIKDEITANNDDNNNLYVVDMSKINVESVNIGKGSVSDMDVFLVAENTHNVYYLKGINYKSQTFHSVEVANIPVWEQDRFSITKGDKTLEAGDLIQYDDGIEGYAGSWKVLGAENGNLLIMSTEDVDILYLFSLYGNNYVINGIEYPYGVLNGIEGLNESCAPYKNGKGAVGVRSITIEDIDKLTGYDKTKYDKGKLDEYNNELTYSWNSTEANKVDYECTNGLEGTLNDTYTNGFTYLDFNTNTKTTVPVNGEGMPTIKSICYTYKESQTSINEDSQKAKNMLFGESNDYNYWLASHYVRPETKIIRFGLFCIKNGSLSYGYLYSSFAVSNFEHFGVRAVVKLSPNIVIGEKDEELGWSYKI